MRTDTQMLRAGQAQEISRLELANNCVWVGVGVRSEKQCEESSKTSSESPSYSAELDGEERKPLKVGKGQGDIVP